MVHITEGLLQLGAESSEGQVGCQIGKAVAPGAPPSKSPASEESDSKLAPMDIISKASGVHILAHSEDEIAELVGCAIKIGWALNFYCFLSKNISCWGYSSLGGSLRYWCNSLGGIYRQLSNLLLQTGHSVNQLHCDNNNNNNKLKSTHHPRLR